MASVIRSLAAWFFHRSFAPGLVSHDGSTKARSRFDHVNGTFTSRFCCFKAKQDGLAGFFLALGLYKPQLVLPTAGALVVARRWHSLAVFTITGVILVAISLGMVGWQGVFDFVSILRSMEDYSFIIHPANMPNVRGFILRPASLRKF
jgi:hypothetical protein